MLSIFPFCPLGFVSFVFWLVLCSEKMSFTAVGERLRLQKFPFVVFLLGFVSVVLFSVFLGFCFLLLCCSVCFCFFFFFSLGVYTDSLHSPWHLHVKNRKKKKFTSFYLKRAEARFDPSGSQPVVCVIKVVLVYIVFLLFCFVLFFFFAQKKISY